MKIFQRLMGILTVAVILAFSCSKPGSVYDGTSWFTETGLYSSIKLTFSDGGQKCMVLNVAGFCGLGCEYEVEWAGRNSFKLVFKEDGQSYVSYKGVINGDTLLLDKLSLRYQIQETYELKRKN